MEFAKADVNSPRSVRALSKVRIVIVMKLREFRQTRMHKSSILSSNSYNYMCVTSNTLWLVSSGQLQKRPCVNLRHGSDSYKPVEFSKFTGILIWLCKQTRTSLLTATSMLVIYFRQSFHKQLLSGKKVSISSAVPRPFGTVHSQHAMPPRQVPPAPVVRQPLVGIDLQALNQAQKALKPPHASGNAKYMKGAANEPNKVYEISKINVFFGFELSGWRGKTSFTNFRIGRSHLAFDNNNHSGWLEHKRK